MSQKRIQQIEQRIDRIKKALLQIGPMRPGSLTRQYQDPRHQTARELAQKLTAEWLEHNARYSEPAWLPPITAQRFLNLFAHGRFFLHGSDVMWRSKLFVSLRNQARVLARRMRHLPPWSSPGDDR